MKWKRGNPATLKNLRLSLSIRGNNTNSIGLNVYITGQIKLLCKMLLYVARQREIKMDQSHGPVC
jgi:hypothetical protein